MRIRGVGVVGVGVFSLAFRLDPLKTSPTCQLIVACYLRTVLKKLKKCFSENMIGSKSNNQWNELKSVWLPDLLIIKTIFRIYNQGILFLSAFSWQIAIFVGHQKQCPIKTLVFEFSVGYWYQEMCRCWIVF